MHLYTVLWVVVATVFLHAIAEASASASLRDRRPRAGRGIPLTPVHYSRRPVRPSGSV